MNEFSSAEKLHLTLKFLRRKSSAKEFCTANGLSTKTAYNWYARLLTSAPAIFRERRGAPRRIDRGEVISRLRAENAALEYRISALEDALAHSLEVSRQGLEAAQPAEDYEREREFLRLYGVNEKEIEAMVYKNETRRGRKSLRRTLAAAEAKKARKEPPAPDGTLG